MRRVGTAENKGGRITSAQVILPASHRLSFYFPKGERRRRGDGRTDTLSRRGDRQIVRLIIGQPESDAQSELDGQNVKNGPNETRQYVVLRVCEEKR